MYQYYLTSLRSTSSLHKINNATSNTEINNLQHLPISTGRTSSHSDQPTACTQLNYTISNSELYNFMHSVYYTYAPKSFKNTWQKNADRAPDLNLRNANENNLLHPRTDLFKKSTYYSLPLAWNNLAIEIKLQQNRSTFRWALKAHLFQDIIEP